MSDKYLYLVLRVAGGVKVGFIDPDVNILTVIPSVLPACAYICGGHLYISVRGKYATRAIPRWFMSTRKLSDVEIDILDSYYVHTSNGTNREPRRIIPYVGGIEVIDSGGKSSLLDMEEIPKDVVRLVSAVLG